MGEHPEDANALPEGEGLPDVPGGWKVVYAAPDRLTAIRVQGLLEELGYTTYILEEAMGFVAPLGTYRGLPVVGRKETDSHLVAPATVAAEVERVVEQVTREMAAYDRKRIEEKEAEPEEDG